MLLPGEREEDLLRDKRIHALIQQAGGPRDPQIIRRCVYTFSMPRWPAPFQRGVSSCWETLHI